MPTLHQHTQPHPHPSTLIFTLFVSFLTHPHPPILVLRPPPGPAHSSTPRSPVSLRLAYHWHPFLLPSSMVIIFIMARFAIDSAVFLSKSKAIAVNFHTSSLPLKRFEPIYARGSPHCCHHISGLRQLTSSCDSL